MILYRLGIYVHSVVVFSCHCHGICTVQFVDILCRLHEYINCVRSGVVAFLTTCNIFVLWSVTLTSLMYMELWTISNGVLLFSEYLVLN